MHLRKFIVVVVLLTICILATPGSVFAASATQQPSNTPIISPHHPGPNCLQPSRTQDLKKLTKAERIAQGYPIPAPGSDFSAIDRIIQQKGVHYCPDTDKNTLTRNCPCDMGSNIWAGNYATASNYTLAYGQWVVSCIAWGTNDYYSTWVGIGGGVGNLVQAGTTGYNASVTSHNYYAWVENTGSTGSDHGYAVGVFNVSCGDAMFAEIGSNNCMYISDLTSGINSGWHCYGPAANSYTANFFVERPEVNNAPSELSNFGTETFYNCYVAANAGNNVSIGHSNHDYTNMYQRPNGGGSKIATVGPITGSNLDTFAVTWHSYN